MSVGPVTIPGCIVHCFGVITGHLLRHVDNLLLGAALGLVFSDPFRCCGSPKLKNVCIPNIFVQPLPLLVSYFAGGDGAIVLYEGEIREVRISLANAGTYFTVQKKSRFCSFIFLGSFKIFPPFKSWSRSGINCDLESLAGPLNTSGDPPTNGFTVPPGRCLLVPLPICVLQGLSFVKARLLSMELSPRW